MNFGKVRHLHFVGIGGSGMCGLAELLHHEGLTVSGCDLAESETTARLRALGIPVAVGHDPAHVHEAQLIVVSSAVAPDHPELEAARAAAVPVIRRAEMLGEISRLRWTVAVAGTHGKTTTTSMTGWVFTQGGLDPTVIVGGRMNFVAAHARLGHSEYLVCEADEFDRSFLALHPVLAILTSVEPEHLDFYRTAEALEAAFVDFANRVPFYGATIVCLDDPGVRALLPSMKRRVVTYGFSPQAEVRGRALELDASGGRCRVDVRGESLGEIRVNLPGRHTVSNALAVVAAGLEVGMSLTDLAGALETFSGVARRFELKGERDGVVVIDDYAHHPTEVAVTFQSARQRYPDARLVAAFQPHLFSRTQLLAQEFGEVLLGADVAIVLPIYPAREQPVPGVTNRLVVDAARRSGHRRVMDADSLDAAVELLDRVLRPGDVLLTLGAGNVVRLGEQWLAGGRS